MKQPQSLAALGADRFRCITVADPPAESAQGTAAREGLVPMRTLSHRLSTAALRGTSTSASNADRFGAAVTPGPNSDPETSKSGEKEARPGNQQGFAALSLRLGSSRLQQRIAGEPSAGNGAFSSGSKAHSDRQPHDSTSEAPFSERCGRAMGEVLAKRAKAGHPLTSRPFCGGSTEGAEEAAASEGAIVASGEGFKRGRLAEWMELAVQHAPPAMRQQRAVPGGIQDAYLRAVRSYLTGCSLAARQEVVAEDCKVNLEDTDTMVTTVLEVYPGQEGTLLTVQVMSLPSSPSAAAECAAAGIAVASSARLILHHRHPALTTSLDAQWPPTAGTRVLVRGFQVASKPNCRRQSAGPLLIPLAMELASPVELIPLAMEH